MTTTEDDVKEVFTKSFWRDVKKIYVEALESPPPEDGAQQAPAEPSPQPETPSPPSPSNEQL